MSRRIPPSAMTKLVYGNTDKSPIFKGHIDELVRHAVSTGSEPSWRSTYDFQSEALPFIASRVGINNAISYVAAYGHLCVAAARWSTCKQVYRLDRDFAEELFRQGLPDTIPSKSLISLPYPIIFVETPFDVPVLTDSGDLISSRACGFAAWLDIDELDKTARIFFMPIDRTPDKVGRFVVSPIFGISLSEQSFASYLDRNFKAEMKRIGFHTTQGAELEERWFKAYKMMFSAMLNSLLYILADNADVETIYVPNHNAEKKTVAKHRNTSSETIRKAGVRLGSRIREARRMYESTSSLAETGRTVRPHIRKGHYQHYWTGRRWPGHPGDNVIVHYIEPIFVCGITTSVDEVVHPS